MCVYENEGDEMKVVWRRRESREHECARNGIVYTACYKQAYSRLA